MPMLTTLRMRRPVWPSQRPERTSSAKAAIRSSTSWTSGTTSWPSTTIELPSGARRATCSTARSSVTLICSPANMASIRWRSPARSARATSSAERLGGDPVLGVVEVEVAGLAGQRLAPPRVVGEQLAQVDVPDRLVVPDQGLPLGGLVDAGRGLGHGALLLARDGG